MKSILHKASRKDITDKPFPHIVFHNALEDDLYEELAPEFPDIDVLLDGGEFSDKGKCVYPARDILSNSRISSSWLEFTAYHVSRYFHREVISLFGDHIKLLHPDLETWLGKPLEDMEPSIRFKEEFKDIALECQFVYGAPVSRPSRTRGPHLDRQVALYAGLLYFRLDHDDSTGGDMELYRFKSSR